ncbi:aluminum-activated malate transporter 8-like [Salvia miltiorrhiza]|uniref:aluminum-activated malate transporter 8-like n=1 Tax=Salvia miltiorrhiza TaxID=226208 RepID=UPI0025AC46B7|nr:aluminum-activated malate transporter 8-like [Salvia miltiorrhiza]
MEMNSQNQEKSHMASFPAKLKSNTAEFINKIKKIGEEDPRRIIHSAKVGLALTLVSFFYYFRPLYDGFGQAGMWAILTVVVVFEFTVGGTLSKCINRGCATLLAGALGVGAEYLASVCGEKGEPVVLGLMVFSLAAVSTFTRFFPNVKRKYDYGVLIFILTFSLVAVSGYRVGQILELAHQRLSTILIGGATCMIISIFFCPVWAGQDLHYLVAANIEKLAAFLQGFGGELLTFSGDESIKDSGAKNVEKSFLKGYKNVLNSKATEESLANFAWWEPPHGKFKFNHPWKQYLRIGGLSRECACLMESLNAYTNSKSLKTATSEFQIRIRQSCVEMSTESGKALNEIATAIKKMRQPPQSAETHAQKAKSAADRLKTMLHNSSLPSKPDLQEMVPLLVIASVLIDIINCVDEIALSVRELSRKARFKNPKSIAEKQAPPQQQILHRGIVSPVDGDHVVVEIQPPAADLPEKKLAPRRDTISI